MKQFHCIDWGNEAADAVCSGLKQQSSLESIPLQSEFLRRTHVRLFCEILFFIGEDFFLIYLFRFFFGWCVCVCIWMCVSVCTSMCVGICVFLCVSLSLHVCFYVSVCPCATMRVWRSENNLPKVLVLFFHHVGPGDWITGFKLGGKCLYSLRYCGSTIFSFKIILLFSSIYMCAFVGWYMQVSTDAPRGHKRILGFLKL